MQRWQPNWLGTRKLPPDLTPFDLDQFFTFDEVALEVIDRRRRPVHRLGIALQIGFVQLSGRTLNAVQRVPRSVLRHVAQQLAIEAPDIASLRALYRRRPTLFEHQKLAIEATGFRPLPEAAERGLMAHLRREATREFTVDLTLLHKGAVATKSSLIRYGIRRPERTLAFQGSSCDSKPRI